MENEQTYLGREGVRFGRRLVNIVVDERAAAGHEQPFASIPLSSNPSDGFRDISYATLANAVNRCSHWLETSFGISKDSETIVYLGPSDLRYHVLALAAVKTGYVMFFPSPRNTLDALNMLFENAKATKIISPSPAMPIVNSIVKQMSMNHTHIGTLEEILDESPVPARPFAGTFEEYRFKPWVKLHTSGSTGNPKIVDIKHGLISAVDAYPYLEGNEVPKRLEHARVFVPFPAFHLAGLNYGLPIMVWYDSTAVFSPSGALVTADLVHSVHVHGRVDHTNLAPSLIGDLAKDEERRAQFGKLKGLTFSGGPLSQEVASIVSKYTHITPSMGATEYGGIPSLPKSGEDWNYFRFDEKAAGLDFQETDQPGLYELVFVRQSNEISNLIQAIFVTFPDVDEYHTRDCFTKHPSKPGLWKYEMRLDDVVVLSNGEKFNPVQMEGLITSCPEVKGCLVVGQGKFQTALLVERQDPDTSPSDLNQALRPFIDRANKLCPTYGRISYDRILITAPDKPLPRAPKGTVQRTHSVNLYKNEIEDLYADLENTKTTTSASQSNLGLENCSEKAILAYLNDSMDLEETKLRGSDDFFSVGMDSLLVISLVRAINSSRKGTAREISPTFVYEYPTAEKLAQALASGARVKEYSDLDDDDEEEKQTWQSMEDLFQELRPESSSERKKQWSHKLSSLLRSNDPPPLYHPDGGSLAWRQVLGSFLINLSNWGLINSFGVYQAYYESAFLQSYSPSTISWIGTAQGTLLLVIGAISGSLFDRGYFRLTLIVAGIGLVFGIMMLSLSTQYYQIMLSQGILVGGCAGLLYIPSIALIPLYFKRQRGLALGLATSGGSVGGVLYPIVFRRLLKEVGFGWATRAIGFISLCTLFAAVLLIKPVGARSARQLLDPSALMDVPYVSFIAAGFLLFAGVLVPYFLATTYALEDLQTSANLSFYMLAILNGAQLFGRILPAFLSDWVGPELILLGAEISAGVVGFCWIAVDGNAGYIVWLVAFGFISGMIVTLPPAVLPYICPSLAVIGTRLGMLYAVAGIGFLISTPIALALNTAANGFLGAQCWIGACCLAAVLFYSVTAAEAWKRRRLYEENGRRHRPYLLRGAKRESLDPEKGY